MRILHIVRNLREVGNGGTNVAVDLACLQAKAGHQVAVASGQGEYESLLDRYGVAYFRLEQSKKFAEFMQFAQCYHSIVKEFQPDIVHVHTMFGVVVAKFFQGIARYKLVSTVHNEFLKSAVLMGLADRVIAVSDVVKQSMHQRGIPQKKLKVVRNGTIGSPRTRPLSDYHPLPLHRPAISSVCGMHLRKGLAELIQSFSQIAAKFPEAHLYLVGDGPDRALLEQKAQETDVANRIHFEGFQPQPQQYLLSTDIFVLVSHKDPSPLAIPEAREAGCAIIASNVDGIPEALDQGQAGLLVPPVNSDELAQKLSQLLSDPNLLQNWRQKAHCNLDWLRVDRVHQETLAIYQELISKP